MLAIIQENLESRSGIKLNLQINDNRSTMLSVKWGQNSKSAQVSLHRMFLDAPQNVMDSLACYLKKEEKKLSPSVRAFIQQNLRKIDYTHRVTPSNLCIQGYVYNLKEIYDELNRQYFGRQLKLAITWFGTHAQRCKSRVSFGLYSSALHLIKINRLLDAPKIPEYVISYVVYHEMLHHICPVQCGKKGRRSIHTKEFKMREEQFHHYTLAQQWIKENKESFFL